MKVLVADNDAQVQLLLSELLEELHDEVIVCGDGHEAVLHCLREHPDLVLMDLHMPRMNGINATRHIMTAYPHMPVLVVTQYNDADLRRQALAAGAQGVYLKDDLLMLQRHLRRLHENQ